MINTFILPLPAPIDFLITLLQVRFNPAESPIEHEIYRPGCRHREVRAFWGFRVWTMFPMNDDILGTVVERLRREVERSYLARVGLEGRTRHEKIEQLEERLKRETAIREAIDAACRHWISTGRWPLMDSDAGFHVCDRLAHSVDLAAWLHKCGFLFEKSENDLMTFFLIENWPGYGVHRMRSQLLKLTWEI